MSKILNKIKTIYKRYGKRQFSIILDSKFGFGKLEFLIFSNWFNPFMTLWINIRSLPLKQSVRFPIFAYGRPKIYSLSGTMLIQGHIRTGMIKLNQSRPGAPSNMSLPSEIYNLGSIVFEGPGYIGTGNKIFVNYNAILTLGKNFAITDFINIGCSQSIEIQEGASITHRCQILDSNYHYVANFNNHTVPPRTKPIIIGKGCWIGNSTTIMGGTKLPSYTIVGSNSLINKSINNIPTNSIVGGIPAKLISTGFRRVYHPILNRNLNEFYTDWSEKIYELDSNLTMEICSQRE